MEEVWKTIEDFPNYEVSNMGNVRSKVFRDSLGRLKGGVLLKPALDGRKCYLHVHLCKDGKAYPKNIHRLVATAFVENPNSYPEVNHIDECKTNNAAYNLEWCTHKYNNRYRSKRYSSLGSRNAMCKISLEIALFIKENHVFCGGEMRNKELAEMFELSPTHVCAIAHGRKWKHAHPNRHKGETDRVKKDHPTA